MVNTQETRRLYRLRPTDLLLEDPLESGYLKNRDVIMTDTAVRREKKPGTSLLETGSAHITPSTFDTDTATIHFQDRCL